MKTLETGYYKFSEYFKKKFGCRVFKVSVDAGFSCPNRDGTKGSGGCIYCDNKGFSFNSRKETASLEIQIKRGIEFARKRYRAEKFIIYFQAYTNTYAQLDVLRERYSIINDFDNIVGLAIGTRPDCIDNEKLDLLEQYTEDYEVWIEYGLQSVHESTLKFINRRHSYADFLKAVKLTYKRGKFKICVHVIIGLPGENKDDVLETAKEIGRLKIDGIKIHPLHIIRGTKMEELYVNGEYHPLDLEQYLELTTSFLEYIHPDTVIQRITADCPSNYLVAPEWIKEKNMILQRIDSKLKEENRYQGRLCRVDSS